jgi:hypothetical protein
MEEATMKKVSGLTALGFMLAIIFAAALPAWAESVDQRISTLEAELARLKAEQVEVKSEQIELRKNALAAEGALPTFTYRPAAGLRIEAADKSWSIRFAMEAHMRMLFESGRSHAGRTNGEVMARRFRPRWNFCVVNCFYEIELAYDNDGFATNSAIQRGAVWVHLEQISPWLPTFYLGMDIPSSTGEFPDGDGFTGWQMEKPIILRALPNTGSASNGFGFNWDDKPLSAIGIPGKITRINFAVAGIGESGDGGSTNADAGHNMLWYINVAPFSELKSKWLEGFEFEMGYWLCKVDPFVTDQNCARLRLRDNGDGGRQTLFDTGSGRIGRGPMHYLYPGVQWEIGPYTLRATGQFARWKNGQDTGADTRPGHTKANGFNISHDLWLFSPKGWLTGAATTPGSVLVGTRFERSSADCNYGGGQPGGGPCTPSSIGFNRIVVLVREWGVYYFLMNRMSVGINWTWYDASNLPVAALANLGILNHPDNARGGSWLDVALNFRVRF